MPDSLKDALMDTYRFANKPLMPKGPTDTIANLIDMPRLERSPWKAKLDGFLAGSLQGARELTSPTNIISMLLPETKIADMVQALPRSVAKAEQGLGLAKQAYNNFSGLGKFFGSEEK